MDPKPSWRGWRSQGRCPHCTHHPYPRPQQQQHSMPGQGAQPCPLHHCQLACQALASCRPGNHPSPRCQLNCPRQPPQALAAGHRGRPRLMGRPHQHQSPKVWPSLGHILHKPGSSTTDCPIIAYATWATDRVMSLHGRHMHGRHVNGFTIQKQMHSAPAPGSGYLCP